MVDEKTAGDERRKDRPDRVRLRERKDGRKIMLHRAVPTQRRFTLVH